MLVLVLGIFFIAVGVLAIALKLYVVYDMERDPQGSGGVPTLDIFIFPAPVCILGLFALDIRQRDVRSFLEYLLIWAAITLVIALLYGLASRIGGEKAKC